MNEETKAQMQKLEEAAKKSKEGGFYMEALQQFEDLLLLQKKFLPFTAGQIPRICEEIVIICNILGMIYLRNESFQMSLDLLKKAEALSKNNLRLRAITCNNLACYYSRTKKVRSAVEFLNSALSIEYRILKESTENDAFEAALLVDNPSDAHLNLCVSLSELGRHEQALQNAMQALVFIQDEIIERSKKEDKANDKSGLLKPLKDRHAVLCIAYHNVAVQHEFLKNYDAALSFYKKALDFASKYLGVTHMITKNMGDVYQIAKEKIAEAKGKQSTRRSVSIESVSETDMASIIGRRSKKEELQALRASLKAQYLKNIGGSPYHKTGAMKRSEVAERLMTPRSKAKPVERGEQKI